MANDRAAIELGRAVEAEEAVVLEDGPHTLLSVKFPLYDAQGRPYAVGGSPPTSPAGSGSSGRSARARSGSGRSAPARPSGSS